MSKQASSKKGVKERLEKDNPEFVSEVAGLSIEQIDARLAEIAKDMEGVYQAKESDRSLEEARALASELSAPYRDGIKALRLKSRYLVALIKEKDGLS